MPSRPRRQHWIPIWCSGICTAIGNIFNLVWDALSLFFSSWYHQKHIKGWWQKPGISWNWHLIWKTPWLTMSSKWSNGRFQVTPFFLSLRLSLGLGDSGVDSPEGNVPHLACKPHSWAGNSSSTCKSGGPPNYRLYGAKLLFKMVCGQSCPQIPLLTADLGWVRSSSWDSGHKLKH